MKITLSSMSLTSFRPVSGGAAATIESQTVRFGALTLASAGGVKALDTLGAEVDFVSVTDQGGSTRTWSVSGGRLIANGTPGVDTGKVLTCTVTGDISISVTIASDANAYDAISRTELDAALDDIGTAAGGARTVYLRKGSYGSATSGEISARLFTNTVTIIARTALEAEFSQIYVNNSDNIVIDGLLVSNGTITNDGGLITVLDGCDTITIQNCELVGIVYDHDADYTSVGHSGNAIGVLRSGTVSANIAVLNNYIHDINEGVVFGEVSGNFEVSGNEICYTYGDCIKVGRVADFGTYTKITDNFLHGVLVLGTDLGNPHGDFIQFLGSTLSANWTGVEVSRNLGMCEERGDAQFCFASDSTAGIFYEGMKVKGNLAALRYVSHGITISRALACEAIGNTMVKITPLSGEGDTVSISVGATESSGIHKIWQNIAEGYNLGGSPSNARNVTLGEDGGTIAYATAFVGPTFSPTTRAELLAKYTMKANGPADIDNSGTASYYDAGAVGSGYVTWPTTVPGNDGSLDSYYETSAPVVLSFSPADNAIDIAVDANLVITFDQNVVAANGLILLYDASDDSLVESFDVTTDVSITDNVVTINPTASFDASTSYYVQVDAGAFENSAGQAYVGIFDETTWNFTSIGAVPTTQFLAAYSDTTNITTGSTRSMNGGTAVSIGTPHADRVLLVASWDTVTVDPPEIGGVAMTAVSPINGGVGSYVGLYRLTTAGTAIENDTTAVITVPNNSGSTSTKNMVGMAVHYPATKTPLDSGTDIDGSTTNSVVANLEVAVNGCMMWVARSIAGTNTVTWNGTDSLPAPSFDADVESAGVQSMCGFMLTAEADATRDLTLAAGTSGTKELKAMSFGAPT